MYTCNICYFYYINDIGFVIYNFRQIVEATISKNWDMFFLCVICTLGILGIMLLAFYLDQKIVDSHNEIFYALYVFLNITILSCHVQELINNFDYLFIILFILNYSNFFFKIVYAIISIFLLQF